MFIVNAVSSVIDFLAGKKTYVVGVLMIVIGYSQHNDQLILEGVSVISLRAGIAKVQ